jgi:hypothetical protein
MLLEGKEMRTFIPTNGRKTGFSGDMRDWVVGKLLKGKGGLDPGRLRACACGWVGGRKIPSAQWPICRENVVAVDDGLSA